MLLEECDISIARILRDDIKYLILIDDFFLFYAVLN